MTKAEDRMDEMIRKGFVPNLFSGTPFKRKEEKCPEEAEWEVE